MGIAGAEHGAAEAECSTVGRGMAAGTNGTGGAVAGC